MGGKLVFCAILLFAGVCMADPDDLMHPTENVGTSPLKNACLFGFCDA